MNQYEYEDEQARRLNSLERQLAEVVAEKEEAEGKYDALFLQVFHEFDQAEGVDMPASFVCDDGMKLARLVPNMQPQVDGKALEKFLANDEAKWRRVTDAVRVVNQDKLAKELLKDPSFGEAVNALGIISKPRASPVADATLLRSRNWPCSRPEKPRKNRQADGDS